RELRIRSSSRLRSGLASLPIGRSGGVRRRVRQDIGAQLNAAAWRGPLWRPCAFIPDARAPRYRLGALTFSTNPPICGASVVRARGRARPCWTLQRLNPEAPEPKAPTQAARQLFASEAKPARPQVRLDDF